MSILAKLAAATAALTLLAAGAAGAVAAPGDLDPTFGDSGEATLDLDGSEAAWALALRPDGRIVVGGPQEDGPGAGEEGFVAQLGASSGALDPSYGGGTGRSLLDLTPGDDGVVNLALRPDGRIVAVGYAGDDGMVARLLATEGTLDASFAGGTGFLTPSFGASTDTLAGLALQPDGRIVAGGYSFAANTTSDALFARLLENGSDFDESFAETGSFSEDFGSTDMQVDDIALQADGRIVYTGNIQTDGSRNMIIGRLTSEGDDDPSFGGGTGRTVIDLGGFDYGVSVVIQPDGKIVSRGPVRPPRRAGAATSRLRGCWPTGRPTRASPETAPRPWTWAPVTSRPPPSSSPTGRSWSWAAPTRAPPARTTWPSRDSW